MDEKHLYLAVRYVERNPVRAGIVRKAEDYPWSSAKAHVFRIPDEVLTGFYLNSAIKDWRSYLQEEEREEDLDMFSNHERTGRPLGSNKFIIRIEQLTGRKLRKQRPGRPKKKKN